MSSPFDAADAVFRLLDREVWIVTAAAGGRRGGLAATWVSPASIDRERPVLLAGIAPNHFTAELIDASGAFVAHLLHEDQSPLAWDFAKDSGRDRDKLAGLRTTLTSAGTPVLADSLAWFACRVIECYDAGDRLYFWGEVTAAEQVSPGPPLRQQTFFRSLTPDQRAHLSACQQADAVALRPRQEAWRQTLAGATAGLPSSGPPEAPAKPANALRLNRDQLIWARSEVIKCLQRFPSDVDFLSAISQLEYLIALVDSVESDTSALERINVGHLAVYQLAGSISHELSAKLCEIASEVRMAVRRLKLKQ